MASNSTDWATTTLPVVVVGATLAQVLPVMKWVRDRGHYDNAGEALEGISDAQAQALIEQVPLCGRRYQWRMQQASAFNMGQEEANAVYDLLVAYVGANELNRIAFVTHFVEALAPMQEFPFRKAFGIAGAFRFHGPGQACEVVSDLQNEVPAELNAALQDLYRHYRSPPNLNTFHEPSHMQTQRLGL